MKKYLSRFQGSEIRLKYLNEDNGFTYGMTNCIFNFALHKVAYYFSMHENMPYRRVMSADFQPLPLSSVLYIRPSQGSLWLLQEKMAALLHWQGHQVHGGVYY